MEISKGVSVDLVAGVVEIKALEGAAKLSLDLGKLAVPMLDGLMAQVESGAIDPVKGTDIDKDLILRVLGLVKGALV